MSAKRDNRAREAQALHANGMAAREIARQLGVSHQTILRDLERELPDADAGRRPPPPERGNSRAVTIGAYRAERLAVLREQASERLSQRFPWLDHERLAIVARSAALYVSLGGALDDLDGGPTLRRDGELKLHPAAEQMEKVGRGLWRMLGELREEDAERGKARAGGLEEYLAERYPTDAGGER